jgi:hypothetical protein
LNYENTHKKKAPTETTKFNSRKRGESVEGTIEFFTNNSCNIVVYDQDLKNIQSIIKVTKRSQHTEKTIIYYYVANFQSNIDLFFTNIRFEIINNYENEKRYSTTNGYARIYLESLELSEFVKECMFF